ncbi:Multiple sugar ABC transporter, membrane-spanning permease protein MsmF [Pseudonocardia sp. Ae406_Ps2]|uniref:carbohydrate ABC transporter permease n=1 Tax=unclassified Pseudonocardia TaxID=2619320 RepID=UPI00094AFF0B|nr:MULTISPECIES: sugar ABC transporter permease [unclassified Pseudonocardia]OLM00740.1 Multiple sugar ABC transporter, membrane-spanning permease protein MsmF [Pseudonocardia sp. Ae406_Ps2]OLM07470.1 Multiple sugar ABC transporter, membrane-spanning permease protein MsmF [Pseudonocardia sp. Ae331_Ps2]OLM14660.1 Multiple sugar ABC transporter, membrane-spanning permease protein MsmF [Pseudonocardia sp. Ae505_Ps2]OLM22317.1 Multiple sugar ABC transporter, membrane-spanning permease protein MsmF 
MSRSRRDTRTAYLLLAPSLLGVVLFLLVPVLIVVGLALFRWDLVGPRTFVGLDNVVAVATDGRFTRSLLVTAFFVLIVIPVQTALGLAAALLLDRGLPGTTVFRVIFVLPWICAPLALGVVWRWILSPTDGALNALLGIRVEWLADPALALPSVAAVTAWTQVGYVALFFLAGLRAIPDTIVEAARLDGASAWQLLWRIRLPLLRPTLFFVLVTGVISSFQVFDSVYALTPNGGPQGVTDVVAGRIYYEAFENRAVGQAAVMAVVLFVILVVVTVAQQRWFSRRTTYELDT